MTSCKVLHRLTPYKHDLKQYMKKTGGNMKKIGGNLKKIGGNTEKKCMQKRENTRTVKSLNSVRFEILKNQSSVK